MPFMQNFKYSCPKQNLMMPTYLNKYGNSRMGCHTTSTWSAYESGEGEEGGDDTYRDE